MCIPKSHAQSGPGKFGWLIRERVHLILNVVHMNWKCFWLQGSAMRFWLSDERKENEKKKPVKKKTPEKCSHLQLVNPEQSIEQSPEQNPEQSPEQSRAARQAGSRGTCISSKEPFFSVDPELGLGPMPCVPTPTALARPVTTQPPGSSQSRAGVDYSL